MGRSKKRQQKRTDNPHSSYGATTNDTLEESTSPYQPRTRFFGQSHYSSIPESVDASFGQRRQDVSHNQPTGYFSTSPSQISNDIRIDMSSPNNNTSTTNGNTANDSLKRDVLNPTCSVHDGNTLYGSDVDTSSKADSIEGDVCFPPSSKGEDTGIDFDAMEAYIEKENDDMMDQTKLNKDNSTGGAAAALGGTRKHCRRLSTMGAPDNRRSSYADMLKYQNGQQESDPFRFTYFSPDEPATIHARSFSEIPMRGEKLSTMIKKGCFWIDILDPTDEEMRALSSIFRIHPLTAEDISMEEQREKCEVFKNYYFICFRTFDQDQFSPTYLSPSALYIVVLKEGVLTFHFRPMPHQHNVRKRIKQLKDYINVTPDWICYGLLDDITDSFAPLIRAVEFEVDSIDELVLILKESEQSDMLRRIGYCRKKMMSLLRLLVTKADVVKTLIKRGEVKQIDGTRPALSNEVALYLGDVQDHIITMLQSLNHYEKISSRSHSNYLAQISIEMTQTNNEINDILSKLTALGSILVPMNLVTGLWGMNVQVPGQFQEDLTWFTSIMLSILIFCVGSTMLMRYYNIV